MSEASPVDDTKDAQAAPELFASFIMCVNRDNPWLNEAIESVLAQDDRQFEFLIGANACSDDLWSKLNIYAAGDARIRLFRTSIGQLSFNLNLLADQAAGEYLVRMDADDVSLPHRLRTLRETLERDPADVLGSAVMLIDGKNDVIGRMDFPESGEAIARALPKRSVICHPSVAIKKAFLVEMRGYLGGFFSEDTDLWLRAVRSDAKLRNLPIVLLHYRVHPNQSIMSPVGYAEVASHWLREWLLRPSWYNLRGLTVAVSKAVACRRLPGVRRYAGAQSRPPRNQE
ncbi:MAG: glycosyltransferase [Alphaproteobacteria bacterium]|uniref:Putative glycosyltransferase n=1 Tax=viral metagenome TaxID=1070528 RepID=A0A6M3XC73_9ZZZZ|nr:glycosyltransferase [Alphaproteobacteria bacterium]MBU1549464.1 glycosyltransferase [Alphaproteobacteria bacterium]MBU2336999.1 glycosyltransferase [Alphaproteobacteria bacterium]MBU2391438.1 glycosyltransferase [Alphaproteobacteria bacterium]